MPSIVLNLKSTNSTFIGAVNTSSFNKPELSLIASALKKYFKGNEITFTQESPHSLVYRFKRILEPAISVGSLKKDDILFFINTFASDYSNIFNTARAVAPKYIDVWKELLCGSGMTLEDVSNIVGKRPPVVKDYSWRGLFLSDPLLFGAIIYRSGYSWRTDDLESLSIYVPQITREKLSKIVLGPDAVKPHTLDELPESHLPVENYEPIIMSDMMYLNGVASSTQILGTSDTFPAAKMKSITKSFDSPDFEYHPQGIPLSRTALLTTAFISMLLYKRSCRSEL